MTFQAKLKKCLALLLCLASFLVAQEISQQPMPGDNVFARPSSVNQRMDHEKAAIFDHFAFDKWKGTCVEQGKLIQYLPVSADMFPPLWKKSIVYFEEKQSNYYFSVRIQDKKNKLNFAEIKLFLNSTPLRAQEHILRYWAALRSNCSMYMAPGVKLDADTAFNEKIMDDSFSPNDIENLTKLGDHCIYSKHNYLSFSRNNVMVSIHFRNNDEKMFQLAQRIDAQLYLASVQSDAESIDIASVPGFVIDESDFSPKPSVGRKREFTMLRRIKQSTGDFWDGLTHGMKKLLR